MALNPFFLHGSESEQRLVQDLINEQLRMYGIDVVYLPRKFIREESVIREITTSKFDDNYVIEAYVNTYDGYSGAGDILTKFGMSLRDELLITISKERFEDFIAPFLESESENGTEITVSSRPREGDLIYFPLGQRIFEVKFVEHEKPFYQLSKTYVYELKCELFEYEDELGGWNSDTTNTEEIDSILVNQGYITSLKLFSVGAQASGSPNGTSSGYVRKILLTNDGYGYTETPTVAISSAPPGGINATAVAITTCKNGVCSVKEILLTHTGLGYTSTPKITISSEHGVGAAATCVIVTNPSYIGIGSIFIPLSERGDGYATPPLVSFSSPNVGTGITATGISGITTLGKVSNIFIRDAGTGYTSSPSLTIAPPPIITGIGTFKYNEEVRGSLSGAVGRVKSWDATQNILNLGTTDGNFVPGDVVVGSSSSARYSVFYKIKSQFEDKYEENDIIEKEADLILDFSESNPFGNY